MNGLHIDQNSFRFTILGMRNFRNATLREAQYKAFVAAMDQYEASLRVTIGQRDHSLAKLAEMDHPYAQRHGSLTLHRGEGGGRIRDGRHMVHRQSGGLLRALKRKTVRTPVVKGEMTFRDLPYLESLLQGDEKMLPRDPLWETAQGPKTIWNMRKAIVDVFGKQLRGQAMLRFG